MKKRDEDTRHLTKRGGVWWISFMRHGKRHRVSTKQSDLAEARKARDKYLEPFAMETEADALAVIANRIQKANVQTAERDAVPALTLAEGWTAYLGASNRPDSGPSTLEAYENQYGQFRQWLKVHYAEVASIRDVTEEHASEYAATFADRSPTTFNKHIGLLRLVWRVLAKAAGTEGNPWTAINRKHLATHSRRELTEAELRTVIAKATGQLRTLLLIGTYTGLRLGDCCCLRWSEVDLAKGVVTRVTNKTSRRNPKPVIVPIHPALSTELGKVTKTGEFVLPEWQTLYTHGASGTGSGMVVKRIRQHLNACGIVTSRKNGTKQAVVEVGFHSLRHSFVSMCRASDVPLSVVESIVGHSNPAMTRHYTHTGLDAARLAVNALPDVNRNLPCKKGMDARMRALALALANVPAERVKRHLLAFLNR